MTPEERIRRLRDGARWQMEPLDERPRVRRRAESRPRPWAIVLTGLATAAVAAVVIVAAVGLRHPSGGIAQSPSATATSPTIPDPTPTDTAPTQTAPPTSSATADPPPTNTASAGAATLTSAGYGDVTLGAPVPGDTTLVRWDPTYCPALTDGDVPQGGRWIAPHASPTTDDPDGGVTVRTEGDTTRKNGRVEYIFVTDPAIRTKSGAHVGMTRAQLTALLPGLVHRSTGGETDVYSASQGGQRIVFEVANTNDVMKGVHDRYPQDTVMWITVEEIGTGLDGKPDQAWPSYALHGLQSCA
jgi:hypothetical protein